MPMPGGIRAGRAFVEVGLDKTKFVKGLRLAEGQLRQFGQKIQTLGMQFARAGGMLSLPFAVSAKVFVGFDDQMKTVQAVTRATGNEFEQLTEKAKLLGRTTSFTAAQVAAGMVVLGRQGFSSAEIDSAIASVLALARATNTDLSEAAMYASDTLRSFGMDAGQMNRVVDVLTATANNSAQTLEDLGQSMKYAAPIAQKYGSSIEETANALGILANVGIKGSMAGTGIRTAMVRLSDPKIRKRLQDIGVEVGNIDGNMRGFLRVMKEVGQATENMGSVQRLSILGEIFGKRALSAGASLTTESFERLEKAIYNALGMAQKTMEVMESGLGGSFRRLRSAIEGVALAVGKTLEKPLMIASKTIKEISLRVVKFVNENKKVVQTVAAIAAGLVLFGGSLIAAGWALKIMSVGFSTIIGVLNIFKHSIVATKIALKILHGALLLITSPIGIIITSFGALAAGILISSGKAREGIENLARGFQSLKGDMVTAWTEIVQALKTGNIGLAVKIAWLTMKIEFEKGIHAIKTMWSQFEHWFLTIANDAWTGILSGWQLVQKGIMVAFVETKAGLLNKWEDLKDGIYKIGMSIQDIWHNVTDAIAGYIAKLISKIVKLSEALKIANEKRIEHRFNPARAFFEAKAEIKKMWEEDTFLKEMQKELESDKQSRKKDHQKKLEQSKSNRAARKREIETERRAIREGIDEGISEGLRDILGKNKNRQNRIDQRHQQQVQGYQSELDAAQKEWQDTIDDSKSARESAATKENRLAGRVDKKLMKEQYDQAQKELEGLVREKRQLMSQPVPRDKESREETQKAREELDKKIEAKRAERDAIKTDMKRAALSAKSERVQQRRQTVQQRYQEFMQSLGFGLRQVMAGFEGSVAGSFSGFSRFGMQGESTAQERTATAVEEISRNTKDLLEETRNANDDGVV